MGNADAVHPCHKAAGILAREALSEKMSAHRPVNAASKTRGMFRELVRIGLLANEFVTFALSQHPPDACPVQPNA